mmetsp:Transcript_68058/g.142126  ORF Transcript_68058/g.142126 Transcript_68058/m.142126 type:complete len:239 (-) Transcript_68058:569-1285(-)
MRGCWVEVLSVGDALCPIARPQLGQRSAHHDVVVPIAIVGVRALLAGGGYGVVVGAARAAAVGTSIGVTGDEGRGTGALGLLGEERRDPRRHQGAFGAPVAEVLRQQRLGVHNLAGDVHEGDVGAVPKGDRLQILKRCLVDADSLSNSIVIFFGWFEVMQNGEMMRVVEVATQATIVATQRGQLWRLREEGEEATHAGVRDIAGPGSGAEVVAIHDHFGQHGPSGHSTCQDRIVRGHI